MQQYDRLPGALGAPRAVERSRLDSHLQMPLSANHEKLSGEPLSLPEVHIQ